MKNPFLCFCALFVASTAFATTINLSTVVPNSKNVIMAKDGDVLTGTLEGSTRPYKIEIASGASVTLDNVTVNGANAVTGGDNKKYPWAGITCIGNCKITLAKNSKNTVTPFSIYYPGIHIKKGMTLVIDGDGSLEASSYQGAGIGGGYSLSCGNIEIKGGNITAKSVDQAAGIGGGYSKNDYTGDEGGTVGNITISGGNVTAFGGNVSAAIGAGNVEQGRLSIGKITISGGSVTANGGHSAAAIGTGYSFRSTVIAGGIEISGGTVVATGGGVGIGIGIVNSTTLTAKAIVVSGGNVTATGGKYSAGIGFGYNWGTNETKSTIVIDSIVISGGVVEATGGEQGAGIGMGRNESSTLDSCGKIVIRDAAVKATKGKDAMHGIGFGMNFDNFSNPGIGVIEVHIIEGDTLKEGISKSPFKSSLWVEKTYDINVPTAVFGGRVESDRQSAAFEEKVTLSIIPEEGYWLKSLVVTEKDGSAPVAVKGVDFASREVTFKMPSVAVDVQFEFTNEITAENGAFVNMIAGERRDLILPSTVKSFHLYDNGGKDGAYRVLSTDYLYIQAPNAGERIKVTGFVNTENDLNDYMIVYDGPNSSPSYLLRDKEQGENHEIEPIVSSDNAMLIFFRSDLSGHYSGLDLVVTVLSSHLINVLSTEGGYVQSSKHAAFESESVSLTVVPDEGYKVKSVLVNDQPLAPQDGAYSFSMPNEKVLVQVEFEILPVSVSYVDADGQEHEVMARPLTGKETELTSGWYVVSGDVAFEPSLKGADADVNLILADEGTLSIDGRNGLHKLSIYGQRGQTGKLISGSLKILSDLEIHGGVVESRCNGQKYAMAAENFTIDGGKVAATCVESIASEGASGIVLSGSFNVLGGEVVATAKSSQVALALNGVASVNLMGGRVSLSASSDNENAVQLGIAGESGLSVQLGSARVSISGIGVIDEALQIKPCPAGAVVVQDGVTLYDEFGLEYAGELTESQISAIGGKTLYYGKLFLASGALKVYDMPNGRYAELDGNYAGSEAVLLDQPVAVNFVSLERKWTPGVFSTLTLPFDVSTGDLVGVGMALKFNGLKQKEIDGKKQWVVRMKKVWEEGVTATHQTLDAYMPYMVLMQDYSIMINAPVTLAETPVEMPVGKAEGTAWEFHGTYTYKLWKASAQESELGRVYGFAAETADNINVGQFVKAGDGAFVNPFRAYLLAPQTASSVRASFAGDKVVSTMGIPEIIDVEIEDGDGDEPKTTVIGKFNTRTGEFRMDDANMRTFDVKGRNVGNKANKARGSYYGKKFVK